MTIKKTLILIAFAGLALSACQQKTAKTTVDASITDPVDTNEIDIDVAKHYVQIYKDRAGTVDSILADGKTKALPNTRCLWLDTGRLVRMLNKIRKEKGDGIRVYLAAYPPRLAGAPVNAKDHPGYTTMVLVSTKDSVNKKNQHFHRDYYTNKTANGPSLGFIIGTPPQNRGEMCPPPSNCPAVGATLIE